MWGIYFNNEVIFTSETKEEAMKEVEGFMLEELMEFGTMNKYIIEKL